MKSHKLSIYQVLPRLFGNRKSSTLVNGSKDENGCGKFNDFTPQILNEIKELGITHVWYTGVLDHSTQTDYSEINKPADSQDIVKGVAGSPYAIRDYFDVSPDLAESLDNRMEEFTDLVTRTHECNLKVILDFVPNHVARSYHSTQIPASCKEFGSDDDTSSFYKVENDFYYLQDEELKLPRTSEGSQSFKEYPAKATGNDAFTPSPSENDWYETIKLNYGIAYHKGETVETPKAPNPLWFKMFDILNFWASKGVDGFRCDMAEMVPVSFWHWVIPKIKEKYPSIIFIAEVYDSGKLHHYTSEKGFDYLYDKTGFYDLGSEILINDLPVKHLTQYLSESFSYNDKMLRFLENHDEVRIASNQFLKTPLHAIPLMSVAITSHKGPTMVYFGQELGEKAEGVKGFSQDDGKTSIFDYCSVPTTQSWIEKLDQGIHDENDERSVLRDKYKTLLKFSLASKAIQFGDFIELNSFNETNSSFNSKKVVSYLRVHDNDVLLCIANFHFTASQFIQLLIPEKIVSGIISNNSSVIKGEEIFNTAQKNWSFEISNVLSHGVQISLWANSFYVFKITTY